MAEFRILSISALLEPPLPIRAAMDDDKLAELADSIRTQGILQPLVVVPNDNLYEIVDGHRRYMAAIQARLDLLPCLIYPTGDIAKEAAMLHANLYREDISPAEEAIWFQELIEKYDLTEDALCKLVRQKPEYIYARLDLLRGDEAIFHALLERKINFSVAQQLARINENTAQRVLQEIGRELDPRLLPEIELHRRYLLQQAIAGGASTSVIRQWVEQWKLSLVPPAQPGERVALSTPGPAPVVNPVRCHFCGGDRDPYNLVQIYVHQWELARLERLSRGE